MFLPMERRTCYTHSIATNNDILVYIITFNHGTKKRAKTWKRSRDWIDKVRNHGRGYHGDIKKQDAKEDVQRELRHGSDKQLVKSSIRSNDCSKSTLQIIKRQSHCSIHFEWSSSCYPHWFHLRESTIDIRKL